MNTYGFELYIDRHGRVKAKRNTYEIYLPYDMPLQEALKYADEVFTNDPILNKETE
ncbi:MAG: hypothetical protein OXF77_00920 [Thaumarchaeota archaeon]|nr:hypothetical protein [Nitrososphaerota archaeon]